MEKESVCPCCEAPRYQGILEVRSDAGAISWSTIITTALLWPPEVSHFGAYRVANLGCENLIGPLIYKAFVLICFRYEDAGANYCSSIPALCGG